ncbi:neuroblast differentiation-associated protein AHNAK [Girardinichthys multiradiatus]|uniref:neuroblast differentiation-associated protein AHNAK n=1 Tax=Girardinichthys multiradiatus TaxID=208333 RepID=UPI001FAB3860|nr:neuroblast differentiation-associated protein AHNAK [Girardinichthys multiradiatus]
MSRADSDIDQEDSHVYSQTRDQAVKEKRRSPPSTRSPSAPQRNPHHSGAADEQESPERVVQKEKLHAELKQVLSQKRSHLRESTCKLAQPEMDSEPAEEQTCMEEVSKSVEIVVETEAEVGASGYSVTGGGHHGIFVKDVLKDSPAAKHLSLQQGDQLLSAKVYFDNVRYEDALRILQCAEPYKVSFQVKRTVPKAEVSVRPRVPSGEVKGPKAKMARMSVKGMKPFKTQKKRGGRFGLKRLKEKRKEELVIEGTPPRLETGDVDVEFSLPKLKQRKSTKSDVDVRGAGNREKAKTKIRFPHIKAKGYCATGGNLELEGHENMPPSEIPRAKVKPKGKGHKFGIMFPKTKHTKSGSAMESGSVEVRPLEITIQPPLVEVALSSKKDKNVEKRGSKFNPPDVEFELPSGKTEVSLPTVKGTTDIKAPKVGIKGEADVPQGKVNLDVGREDAKLRMPKLKLPKIRLSRHSDEIDGEIKVKSEGMKISGTDLKTPTAQIRGDGEINLPEVEVTKPKIKGDISGKAPSVEMPTADISLPKLKGKSDTSYSPQGLEGAEKSEINMSPIQISVPDPGLQFDSGRRIPDEVEGTVKGPKISVPKVDISLPKAPGVDIKGPGGAGNFNAPFVDVSFPKMKSDGVDVDIDHYVGGDGKFKLPDFDVTLPKMKSPEEDVEVGFKLPKIDLTLPKSNAGATDNEEKGRFQLPSVDILLPKLKAGEVDTEGQTVKGGKFVTPGKPLPKGKIEGNIDVKGHAEGDKFKMPSIDVSPPKLKPEGHTKAPKPEIEGEISVSSAKITMLKGKAEGDVEIGGQDAKGGEFKMPSVNIKLPQTGTAGAEFDIQGPEMPSADISLPKPTGEVDTEGRVDGGQLNTQLVNISLPKIKLPEDVKLEAPELPNIDLSLPTSSEIGNVEFEGSRGAKFKMPTFDISFPKGKTEEREVDIKDPAIKGGAKFNMPSLDISLPTIKSPEGGADINIEGHEIKIKSPKANLDVKGTEIKESKMKLPAKNISLTKEKVEGKVNVEEKRGKLKMPSLGASFAKVKMPEENIEIEGQSVDISLPTGKLDVDKGTKSRGGHFHLPSVDIFLPKIKSKRGDINIEGPELGSGQIKAPTIDISLPQGTFEGDIVIDDGGNRARFNVPSVDIDLPSVKIPERDVNFQGPKVKGCKFEMPKIDLSLPTGKIHGNIDIDIHTGKDGNIEIPSHETKLLKGQGKSGVNVKVPEGKAGKLKMPKFKVSAPKLDVPEGDVKVQGPEVKGNTEMPAVDISPHKGRIEGGLDIDSHEAKGAKFHMPSIHFNLPNIKSKEAGIEGQTLSVPSMDISAPKIKSPEVDVSLKGPGVDITLPKPKTDVKIAINDPEIKGGKTKKPTFDISMPKINFPEGEIKLKGPDFKGKKIELPDIDISLAKGKSDGEIDEHGWKGGKFHIPSVDFSLPKIKAKGPEVNIEGPELEQGNINMPDIDISLPKGKADVDLNVESTEGKGGKFKMPKFDISLPRKNLPEGHVDAPKVDISLPKVKGDVDVDIEGKFQLPSIDVSLPKIKANEVDIDTEGPELKSDITLPTGKVEGDLSFKGPDVKGEKFNLPAVDISFSKGKVDGDFDVEGSKIKAGKFKMPKFDVSLPKVSLPEGDIKIKDPSIKGGKIEMLDIDTSIPKGRPKGEIETGGHACKGSQFQMPSVDISLPKIKAKGPELGVEIPGVQGGKENISSLDVSVPKLKSPELDISLEGLDVNVDVSPPSFKAESDVNAEEMDVKGGKFKIPKFGVSLPKIGLPRVDTNIEGPQMKGKAKITTGDTSLPKGKAPEINVEGPETEGGKVNLPSLGISLAKTQSPDIDANLKGPDLKGGKIKMPGVDISLPKGKTDGDLDVEAPETKGGKFKLPKFDISLPKATLPKTDVSVQGPDMKGEMEEPAADISLPKVKTDVEIDIASKFHMPSVDISVPIIKGKEAVVDIHGPKIKGDVSHPKIKSSDTDITIKAPEIEGGKVHLPNMDVSFPKAKVEGNVNAEGIEMKGGKFKMPKFDVSLPKINLPKVEVNVEGPDMKGKIAKPTADISLPDAKTVGDINIESGHGSKFHMPSVDFSLPNVKAKGAGMEIQKPDFKADLSLPKVKCPEADISLRGPEVDQPIPDISYPKGTTEGGLEVESPEVKGGKFKMPKFDMTLPKVICPESDLKIKGPELKTGKIELPDIDLSLPKGKVEGNISTEGHAGKGGKFHMPNIDISLPTMKAKGTEINLEGPEFKGGKLNIPETNISPPKGKVDADLSIKGQKIKGGKVNLPKVDISLPKLSVPEGGVKVEGPDVKGKCEIPATDISTFKGKVKGDTDIEGQSGKKGKFQFPSIDIYFPKIRTKGIDVNIEVPEPKAEISAQGGQFEGDLDVEEPNVKGSKLKVPTFDVSLPKVNLSGSELKIKGSAIEGGKIEMPDVDISLPRGKTGGEIEAGLRSTKEGKSHMPSIDITIPKLKAKGPDVNVEGPEIQGGKIKMPGVDVSLPKGKVDGDFDVEAPEMKGGKFKLPKFDISLPKVSLPKTDVGVEGTDIKGEVELLPADISRPNIKTDVEIDVNGATSSKFHMPSVDISLPKIKAKGDVDIQGPKINGDFPFPKIKSQEVDVSLKGPEVEGGKIHPAADISLPKGKVGGDYGFECVEGKRSKFKMPKVDVSLPKVSLPERDVKIKGPDIKAGNIEMPDIDLSLPKPKVEGEIDTQGHLRKGGKIHIPSIALPDMKTKEPQANIKGLEADVNIKGPDVKGGKGGRFHMPALDINMPKFDLDLSLPSGSKDKGLKVEVSGPDASGDLEMLGLKGYLKPDQLKVKNEDVEGTGASLKRPSVKLPTVDISAPKVDLDFGLHKPNGDDVEVELLKAEGGRPSSGGSFDLPNVSLKVPSFTFPRFGVKSKSGDLEASGLKTNASLHQPDVEGEIRAPSVEFDEDGKVKMKKPKIKIPSFRKSKTDTDISMPCPNVDVKMKKGTPDLRQLDCRSENTDNKVKHKVKFPKFKMSSPKVQLPEGEVDAKVEAEVNKKSSFNAPDVTLKLPKFSFPVFSSKEKDLRKPSGKPQDQPKVKMPSVELSFPHAKTPETEVLLPKAEVDVSEADIKGYEGNLKIPKMPKIDVSIPKVDLDVSLPKGKSHKTEGPDMELKGGEGKFKMPQITMPTLDVTLPKGRPKDLKATKTEIGDAGGSFKMPHVKMPSVDITVPKADISLSKEKSETSEIDMEVNTEQKYKMPRVDITLPKGKLQGNKAPEMDEERGKIKMPHIKMPHVDISLPKMKTKGPEVEIRCEGGEFKMPQVSMPSVDVSLSKGRAEGPNVEVEGNSKDRLKLPQFKMPNVDVSLPKGQIKGPDVEINGEKGTFKMPQINVPSVEISLPKGKVDGSDIEGDEGEKFRTADIKRPSVDTSVFKGKTTDPDAGITGNVGEKFKMPHLKMPDVDLSVPKGKERSDADFKGEGGKFKMPHIGMPSVDISLPKGKLDFHEVEIEGGREGKIKMPHLKMPNVDIFLPKGNAEKIEGTELNVKGSIPEKASGDTSLEKGQTAGPIPGIKSEGGKFKLPNVDISLSKAKPSVEAPQVDIKKEGHLKMPKASTDKTSGEIEAEGGTIKLPHIKIPKVDISLSKGKGNEVPTMAMEAADPDAKLPKGKISMQKDKSPKPETGLQEVTPDLMVDLHVEGERKGLEMKMPTIDIEGPKKNIEVNIGFQGGESSMGKKKVVLPDLDLNTLRTESKVKGRKVKGANFNTGVPKMKGVEDITVEVKQGEDNVKPDGHTTGKGHINITAPEVTLPNVSLKTGPGSKEGKSSASKEIKVPRIPDIEFDIGTSQAEDDKTETEKKVKIPKFGVPLPSISSPERGMDIYRPDVRYEGPKIPKVKRAVFVLVNPNETEQVAANITPPRKEAMGENETEDVKVKIPKIKTKSNFGMSKDKSAEREAGEEEKSMGAEIKMPKVSFSSGKSGSPKGEGSSSSLKGEKDATPQKDSKDDKGTFRGKIKLPKVELTSPYSKMATGDAMGKDSLSGEAKGDIRELETPDKMVSTEIVSSHARTEMLNRDSSESPVGFGAEFTSTKVQMWSEADSRSSKAEEKETTSWFKVPKFTLKPHATGFLQITPEGTPQAKRKGELGGEAEVSGSFCLHTSGLDFTSQQMSEEHQVPSAEEETVTMVTKTTKITRHLVTTETRTGESSATTHQVSDYKS